MELQEFWLDDAVVVTVDEDAAQYRFHARSLKSPLGEVKYANLANLAL